MGMHHKDEVQKRIEQHLEEGDSLVGFFLAVELPKYSFLIGPLAALGMKTYFVAATARGIQIHKLSMWGKFIGHDFFAYDEIESVRIGKGGLLRRSMKFDFKNGRVMKIKAQLKGVDSVATLTDATQKHIEANITVV